MLHLIIYLVIWLIGHTYYLYVYIELIYICIKPTFVHWFTLTAHSFFFVVVYIHLSKSQIVSYYFGCFFLVKNLSVYLSIIYRLSSYQTVYLSSIYLCNSMQDYLHVFLLLFIYNEIMYYYYYQLKRWPI